MITIEINYFISLIIHEEIKWNKNISLILLLNQLIAKNYKSRIRIISLKEILKEWLESVIWRIPLNSMNTKMTYKLIK